MQRITEDRESGLPRYYYNGVDQFLSPTWSPDGRELILVSNRGHVWGSGGFWRMPARAGGTPRETIRTLESRLALSGTGLKQRYEQNTG